MINIVPLPGLRERDQLKQNASIQAIARCLSNGQVREVLTAARTYYVRVSGSGGSDNNSGLDTSAPFLTLSKALTVVQALDTGGFAVTIDIGAGSFAGATIIGPFIGSGAVTLSGAGIASTTITSSLGVTFGAMLSITGLKFVPTAGNSINVLDESVLRITGTVEFGLTTAGGFHLNSARGSAIRVESGVGYTISGNADAHIRAGNNGSIAYFGTGTITLSSSPIFHSGFYISEMNGSCQWNLRAISGSHGSGAAGENRAYAVVTNGSFANCSPVIAAFLTGFEGTTGIQP